jgi:peroxiredoxin
MRKNTRSLFQNMISLLTDCRYGFVRMMNAFGYYGPKIFMGKEVVGVYRATVVIDEKGIITHIIEDVVSGDHSNQLKTALGL